MPKVTNPSGSGVVFDWGEVLDPASDVPLDSPSSDTYGLMQQYVRAAHFPDLVPENSRFGDFEVQNMTTVQAYAFEAVQKIADMIFEPRYYVGYPEIPPAIVRWAFDEAIDNMGWGLEHRRFAALAKAARRH